MKTIYIAALLLAAAVLTACESLLETEPRQSVSNEVIFEDFDGVQSVMTGVYHDFQSTTLYGRNELVIPELLSDNLRVALQNSNRLVRHSTNQERFHMSTWNLYYAIINALNNVIEAVNDIPGGSEMQKNRSKGEAHFLRGLAYHNLIRTYAREPNQLLIVDGAPFDLGVPLVLKPFKKIDESAFPKRSTVVQVYEQIEKDLGIAIDLLDNNPELFPRYGSQIAAQALLARVYLYQEKWGDAAQMATTVLNSSPVALATEYQKIFSDGQEALFELTYNANEINEAARFLTSQGFGDGVMRESFLENIEPKDQRFIEGDMVSTEVNGPETVTFTRKFSGWKGTAFVDDIAVIRLSEIYLIRAEANVENGSSFGDTPINDLKKIRDRAGLPEIPATIDNILNERRMELAFEGHRFFDLKRKGRDISKGKENDDCRICTIEYEDHRVVSDIAQVELDANPNLVNNPGYQDF